MMKIGGSLAFGWRVVEQDAVCGAFGVVELAVFQRPHKPAKPERAQKDRKRDEDQQDVHVAPPPISAG